MELKWYAVYSRSRWEKKVANSLTLANIENYCPFNKVVKQWSDRKKTVEEPLFSSYVFVRITDQEKNAVRQIYGVVNFVYWLGRPAIITDFEIDTIKQFVTEYVNVKLQKLQLHIDDRIKIINGPFIEMEGEVVSIKKKTVKVLLPSLRYILTAEVERKNVNVIDKPKTVKRTITC
jgi:transcription antitermination factor NusG